MKRNPVWNLPLVFVDVETTGSDERLHEIVEIAIIDELGLTLLHTKVLAERLHVAEAKALEINGYDDIRWRREDALPWKAIALSVVDELAGTLVAGWNPEFDMRFIRWAVRRLGRDDSPLPHRTIDIQTLAWEHLARPRIQDGLSLFRTCETLGISNEDAHTALADARRAHAVYRKLTGSGWLERFLWRRRATLRREARKS